MSDYERIARAIDYLAERVSEQPRLEAVAAHVNLSPYHFQRLFCRWTGTTPKRLLQVLTLERSRPGMQSTGPLSEVAASVGLSGGARLYDHFVQLEAMTPGEFRNQGAGLQITCGTQATPFGALFVAATARGICRAAFLDSPAKEREAETNGLRAAWPAAELLVDDAAISGLVANVFSESVDIQRPLSLQVRGTNLQVAVWRALLRIPAGQRASYSQLAAAVGKPRAARAVANAVAANPVAFLIPCHRVIQQSGALGGYHWGVQRKRAMQVWERARQQAGDS